MAYHTSYAFTAQPDVVFDVLSDLELLANWLEDDVPVGQHVEAHGYRTLLDADELKLCWMALSEVDSWWGRAVVRALPLSGSVVDVRLAVPAEFRTQIHRIDQVLSRVLRRVDAEAGRRCATGPLSVSGGQ
jgi:hypothetical protein